MKPLEQHDLKKLLLVGAFLFCMALLIVAIGIWGLSVSHQNYARALQQNAPLLTQDTAVAVFYAAAPGAIGLLMIGLFGMLVCLRGRRFSEDFNKRFIKVATYLIVAGLIGMLAGRPIGNRYWAETFRAAGYTECSGSFTITKKWFTRVWAIESSHCKAEQVRRMFSSHKYRLSDINEYLMKQEAQ